MFVQLHSKNICHFLKLFQNYRLKTKKIQTISQNLMIKIDKEKLDILILYSRIYFDSIILDDLIRNKFLKSEFFKIDQIIEKNEITFVI